MIMKRDRAGLDARLTPSDLDIAWAAGFYEGEGSCFRNGTNRRSFSISIAQKDPECLYRIRDFFGGTVKEYLNNRGTIASKGEPFTIYAWRIHGDRARVFIGVAYQFLSSRRKSQIDATSLRIFLDVLGNVPSSGIFSFVKFKMEQRQIELRVLAIARNKQHRKDFYERQKATNPEFMEKRRKWTAAWRKNKAAKIVSIA